MLYVFVIDIFLWCFIEYIGIIDNYIYGVKYGFCFYKWVDDSGFFI